MACCVLQQAIFSAVVLVLLIAVLVVLVVLVLLIVLVLVVLILVIHSCFPPNLSVLRTRRIFILPHYLSFILRLENQTYNKTAYDGGGDAAGCGFQPSCQYADEAIRIHSLLDTVCKAIAKSGQWDSCTCTGKIHQWFIDADGS